jgi:hypothetical protein
MELNLVKCSQSPELTSRAGQRSVCLKMELAYNSSLTETFCKCSPLQLYFFHQLTKTAYLAYVHVVLIRG